MQEELRSFVQKHRLIAPGERVVVGFSGGADSACLLHLLVASGFDTAAAHLHHSQRPEGDADVDHCRAFSEKLGIPFFVGKADVPAVAKSHRIGIEEAGRNLRYEFLQMVATQGFQKIATGHTQDDNLESMILHLARGTGMRGLSGIPPKRQNIIRPILFLSREQTHEYCITNNLAYRSDSYNDDESYARNHIRKQAVPALRRANPEAAAHALTAALILREENDLLDALAASHLEAAEIAPRHPFSFIERKFETRWSLLQTFPLALVRRCVILATSLYGGSLSFDQTQAIAEAIHRAEKLSHTAEGGEVAIAVNEEGWSVTRNDPIEPFRQMLTLDGETIADDLGWSLAAWHTKETPAIDSAKTKGDLFLRSLKPGDKIDPPGRGDAKPLAERLARAGIPEGVRARLPIVCDMIGPIWAPIIGPDKRAAATKDTTNGLSFELREITEP